MSDSTDELIKICTHMGICLLTWQQIEEEHYYLFLRLVWDLPDDTASIIYFSPPSFEARRVLVDRLMRDSAHYPSVQKVWPDLNKRIQDAAGYRGRVAHYGNDRKITFTSLDPLEFEEGDLVLAPPRHNRVKEMKGETIDNPNHAVSLSDLKRYTRTFKSLVEEIEKFRHDLPLNLPALKPKSSLSTLGRKLGMQSPMHPSLADNFPSGSQPSGQEPEEKE